MRDCPRNNDIYYCGLSMCTNFKYMCTFVSVCSIEIFGQVTAHKQTDRHIHTHHCNVIPLVCGALRLAPIICTKTHKAVELLKCVLLSLLFEHSIHDLKEQG